MNILVINGSPKGEKSNTFKLTAAFLDGMQKAGEHQVETITVSQKSIEPCRGCFCCWEKTPGKCVLADNMSGILEKYLNAELVVWSFPLYYFGVPSKTKALIDRMLPFNMPDIVQHEDGTAGHLQRYDLQHQKHVLISTCGFFTVQNNFEALLEQFTLIFGKRLTKILCPEGELFRVPQLAGKTSEYLSSVAKAGGEYAEQGCFSDDTQTKLQEPLYAPEQFMAMANLSWEKEGAATQEVEDEAGRLLRQMSVIYKPHGQDKEIVLEFYFTDIGKTYQLVLGKTKCAVKTEGFSSVAARIETSFEVWSLISAGKLSGKEALFQHKYRVTGDFAAFMKGMDCFSTRGKAPANQTEADTRKRTTLWLFIAPWTAFWVAVPISPGWGVYAAMLVAATMPLFSAWFRVTVYDAISVFFVIALSALLLLGCDMFIVFMASYALFGAIWLSSIWTRLPLSAWYSANQYGGEAAFDNPLFLLTNKIISIVWGVLYLASCLWVWALMDTAFFQIAGLINICPIIGGIFTVLFQKWFPAHYARG